MQCQDPQAIIAGISRLGDSVERVFLKDRLRQLSIKEDN
jgi:hypothetical protein